MVREQVALADYTTLRIGGPARRLVEASTETEIVAEVRAADERGEPLLVLGGGSNLVIADEGFPGTVVRVATSGIDRAGGQEQAWAELTVAAGEDWDGLVAACVGENLAGVECLSGIPGQAGATPIQNVGAYGQEVAERIISVRVYDRKRRAVTDMAGGECGFGYRTSAFKRSLHAAPAAAGVAAVTGRYVVLSVRFRVIRDHLSAPVRYAELAHALGVAEGGRAPLAEVRSAVLGLRRGKGMVLDPSDPDTRSVGSFFVNPVLDQVQFAALRSAADAVVGAGAHVPGYPAGDGRVKVSAAWLIERAGFRKGYPGPVAEADGPRTGGARISSKHTLALINPGGATAADLLALAGEVREGVRKVFGVELASEPVLVCAAL
jgi:UDP-N-acetylmuramate dehydrogenase